MRKYLYLVTVAASVPLIVLSAAPAYATTDVLTISKVGGTNVKVGAILKASLASGTKAVFSTSSGSLTCTKSSFTAKVTVNPAKPGTAKESLTAQTASGCSTTISGVNSVTSVTVNNLPYNVTVADSSGFPVKVSETSSTKPLKTTIVLNTIVGTVTCVYTATSISGKASNTGNTVSFTNQKFTRSSGSLCPASGTLTAKYGPVVDSSVSGSPKVFVN